jgi:hypothetical protein
MKCCICHGTIEKNLLTGWDQGNNAQPVMNGRCCDLCDTTVVIPRRINDYMNARRERKEKQQ